LKSKTVLLSEIGEFKNGLNFNRNDYGTGYPIINVKQLYKSRFASTENLLGIKSDFNKNIESYFVKKGDLLFVRGSMVPEGAGQVAMVNEFKEKTVFSGFIIRFRITDKTIVNALFLQYLLGSPEYREMFVRIASGSVHSNMTQGILGNISVGLPDISIQNKTTKILDDLDTKIQNLQNQNHTLEQMAQAIFKSWFVDFDGVTEFEDSELGNIPKEWSVGNLGDICEIIMGSSPPGKSYNEVGDGILFFQGKTDFGDFFPIPRMYCTMPKRFAEKNDVLFTVRAPVGSINVAKEKYCIGRGLASLRLKVNHGCFLYFFLKYLEGKWNEFEADGTVFGSINKDDLSEFKLVISPIELRIKFNNIIKPIYNLIWENSLNHQSLTKTRDSLLPKLMSGEIRV
jgi:type I restriction enzyme, S subunit